MAKVSAIENNNKKKRLVNKYAKKRAELKAIIKNRDLPIEERFKAQLALNELPRNGAKIRLRNRCSVSGRPRGNYRKFKLSRIKFRELSLQGLVPGVTKSSW